MVEPHPAAAGLQKVLAGPGGSLSLKLEPGTSTLYCPHGTKTEKGTLITVTGKPIGTAKPKPTQAYDAAASGYHAYVVAETGKLLPRTSSSWPPSTRET